MSDSMLPSQQHGYTLIELLLYAVMLSILLMIVSGFFATTLESRVKNQTIAEINDQGTALMDYMTTTVHNAASITTPTAGSSGQTLILAMATGSINPTTFNLTSTSPVTLQVKEGGAGAQIPLTNDKVQVTSLTFKNLTRASTPGIVQIDFTLARVNPANRNEFDYQKRFVNSAEVAW